MLERWQLHNHYTPFVSKMAQDGKNEAPATAPGLEVVVIQQAGNVPPPQKPDRIKDIWLPIICAVLGFAFGVIGEVIKQEYQYHMSLPRVRFLEGAEDQVKTPTGFKRVLFTNIRAVGRVNVPFLKVLAARSTATNQITDELVKREPPSAPPKVLEVETPDYENATRAMTVEDLQQWQSVTWKITVESSREIPADAVMFSYDGPANLLLNDDKQSWADHLGISFVAVALLAYSVGITIIAFRLRWKLKPQALLGSKEETPKP